VEALAEGTSMAANTSLAKAGTPGFAAVSSLGFLQAEIRQSPFSFLDSARGYGNAGAVFELFYSVMGNTFLPLSKRWAQITLPTATSPNLGQFTDAANDVIGPIAGKPPADWLNLPRFFYLSADQRTQLGWTDDNNPANGLWMEPNCLNSGADGYNQTIVNPYVCTVFMRERQGSTTSLAAGSHTVQMTLSHAGTVLYTETFTVTNGYGGAYIYSPTQLAYGPAPAGKALNYDALITADFCLYDSGACGKTMRAEFLIDQTGWSKGRQVIMSPGVKLALSPGQPSYTLFYIDGTDIAVVNNLPSVYTDVALTDGTVTRLFPWVPTAPNGNLWDWAPYDNPIILGVVDAATFKPLSQISAGEWITLWTWLANHGAPDFTKLVDGNYPTTAGVNAWGSTQVVFSCGDVKLLGAMDYVAAGQVNVQVPPGLSCATVNVQVSVNGTLSNAWQEQVVAATPAIFLIDATRNIGAIAFATGPKVGQVVTPSNPASLGQALSLYYTGCGPLSEAVPVGAPAPLDHYVYATAQTSLSVGGASAQILFNGLAPGYAGLCQLNFVVPKIAGAGGNVTSSPVALTVASVPANQVVLAVE
jgi:uncharacterized protein (TIGR03437 family)